MSARALEIVSEDRVDSVERGPDRASGARYLYADAEPFPADFDFVTALTGFVDMATRALNRCRDARDLRAEIAGWRDLSRDRAATMDAFTQAVLNAANQIASTPVGQGFLPPRVPKLEAYMTRFAESARAEVAEEVEQACEARAELLEGVGEDLEGIVRQFFTDNSLQAVRQQLCMDLEGERYLARGTQWLAGDITAEYEIDADALGWTGPRRLGDFLDGLTLQVENSRGWLSRSSRPKARAVSDRVISALALCEDGAELNLRKRRDPSDTLTLRLIAEGGTMTAQAESSKDPEEVLSFGPESSEQLWRLWEGLWATVRLEPSARRATTQVLLDGADALGVDRVPRLIERMVALYGPLVGEVGRRSSSSRELALKREYPDGRREEIYVAREQLLSQIRELAPADKAVLDGLQL